MSKSDPVLITGGAGYIGSHTALAFLRAGYQVAVVDDLSTGRAELVPTHADLFVGDVGNRAFMEGTLARVQPQAVIHFAGSIVNEESISQPIRYYTNNTAASLNLIASCLAVGIEAFIFSSSAAIYGNAANELISEDSLPAPVTPYGMSKWMTERMIADISAASQLRYAALRYFNVAGADEAGRSGPTAANPTHLFHLACQATVGLRDGIAIFGTDYDTCDGTCVRDYVHVSDLADAHVAALERLVKARKNFVLNVGYGHGFSVRQVLAKFQEIGADLRIFEAPRRPGDVASLVADNRRILKELNWQPRYDDLDAIVRTAVAWERRLAQRPLAT